MNWSDIGEEDFNLSVDNMRNVSKKRTSSKKKKSIAKRYKTNTEDLSASAGYNLFKRVSNAPLPTKLKCSMIYATNVSINIPAIGAASNHVFSANGLFDPDITGVGHQPRGFDQLMTLYDHYVVIGSRITVFIQPVGTTSSTVWGIVLKDDSTTTNNADNLLEESFVSYKMAAPGSEPIALVQQFNNNFLGYSKPLGVTELEGIATANPTEQAYYHVFGYSPSATDEASVSIQVRIEYQVMLIEPNQPSIS